MDRKALPKPSDCDAGCGNTGSEAADDSNMSALEKLIQECLREYFFEAGGNSLQSMRALAAARKRGVAGIVLRDFFEGRTIAGIAALVQGRETAHVVESDKKFLITPTLIDRPPELPLSFAQSRLFFLDKLKPGMTQYNISLAMKLHGSVDEKLIRHAVLSIVTRHEALRTRFVEGTTGPQQTILSEKEAASAFDLSVVDLPADGEDSLLTKMATDELDKIFDLQRGPLVRLVLCHVGPNRHALIVSMHHIVSDGWSLSVFLKELTHFYNNNTALAALPLQYADFALWQHKFMQGPEAESQISYWKKELANIKQVCDLPLDRPRAHPRTYAHGAFVSQLPSSLFTALVALGRKFNTTPFVTLLSVFQVLLYRLSPNWQNVTHDNDSAAAIHGDIVVGTPTANRHYGGVEGVIGFFINTLAIRLLVDESLGFTSVLQQVKQKMLAAQDAQDVPFEWVVDHVGVERSLEVQPLVQVMFVMDEWEMLGSEFKMNGVQKVEEINVIEREHGAAKLDLTLFAKALPNGGDVALYWEFARDIFDTATIVRMAKSMEVLCQGDDATGVERDREGHQKRGSGSSPPV
ncbi:phosphopantetheine attachment site family protein [Pelomyxa schiedti]|nr:phosphopantetheine attachment site family protein [Pelomyxa schiedti]